MEDMQFANKITEWNHLNYVELHVVDRCNLNCNSCSHFSPLVKQDFDHFLSFQNDIRRLGELFEFITNIRLLGGEPFLEKELDKYLVLARSIFPSANIEVVTNGLLIPSVSDRVLRAVSEQNIIVNVTNYPPTVNILQKIKDTLDKFDIRYMISEPVKVFRKKFLPEGTSDPEKAFSECVVGRHCTFVYCGKLYLCSGAALVKYFNECAGTNIVCKNSYIDLYNTSAREIVEFLQHHNDSCRYCGNTSLEPWSVCTDIELSHWITDGGMIPRNSES